MMYTLATPRRHICLIMLEPSVFNSIFVWAADIRCEGKELIVTRLPEQTRRLSWIRNFYYLDTSGNY